MISTHERQTHSPDALSALAERLISSNAYSVSERPSLSMNEPPNVGLQLAKMLVAMHHGIIDIHENPEGATIVTILFGAGRIRFMEE